MVDDLMLSDKLDTLSKDLSGGKNKKTKSFCLRYFGFRI
jgi:hypothetical protein